MQLSFISDQLMCLVLLLLNLVSMSIMSWYACGGFAMSRYLVQVLMYGACDTPGPAREDIATIIQVQTLFTPHSLLL